MDAAALQAAGWVSREAQGYTGFIAPLWMRGAAGVDSTIRFITDARQANYTGTVHGGALINFATIALGILGPDGNPPPIYTVLVPNYKLPRLFYGTHQAPSAQPP